MDAFSSARATFSVKELKANPDGSLALKIWVDKPAGWTDSLESHVIPKATLETYQSKFDAKTAIALKVPVGPDTYNLEIQPQ